MRGLPFIQKLVFIVAATTLAVPSLGDQVGNGVNFAQRGQQDPSIQGQQRGNFIERNRENQAIQQAYREKMAAYDRAERELAKSKQALEKSRAKTAKERQEAIRAATSALESEFDQPLLKETFLTPKLKEKGEVDLVKLLKSASGGSLESLIEELDRRIAPLDDVMTRSGKAANEPGMKGKEVASKNIFDRYRGNMKRQVASHKFLEDPGVYGSFAQSKAETFLNPRAGE